MMFKLSFSIILITSLFLTSCSSTDENINSLKLRKLILQALAGDQTANTSLKGLLSSKHSGKSDYNQLSIDSLSVFNKTYFSVLLEYYDPTLNLFAIYDNKLKLYLIDKSLNGNLSLEWLNIKKRNLVFLQERFITKDVLLLDRLSIYELIDESALLVYRSLSRFVKENEITSQTIETLTDDKIVTKLQGIKGMAPGSDIDTFRYDKDSKFYISDLNRFTTYVKKEIKEFEWIPTKPQLPSDFSDNRSFLIGDGYKISLPISWEIIPSFTEEKLLRKKLTGTRYFNNSLNSAITVMAIPPNQLGENYSPYSFREFSGDNYKIRSTDLQEIGNTYFQFIEHTCNNKKFLIFFECPKSTYLQFKLDFDNLLESFKIDC